MDGVEFLLLLIWLCLAFGDFGYDNRQELRDIAEELIPTGSLTGKACGLYP